MGSALILAAIEYPFVQRREKPLFEADFLIPTSQRIDTRLSAGAVIFGVGWGLAGLCPGPTIASIGLARPGVIMFVVSMAVGMLVFQRSNTMPIRRQIH